VIKTKKETGEEFLERIGVKIKKTEWEIVPENISLVLLYKKHDNFSVIISKEQLQKEEKLRSGKGLEYDKEYFLVPKPVLIEEMRKRQLYSELFALNLEI
jgi:hypothetical protein